MIFAVFLFFYQTRKKSELDLIFPNGGEVLVAGGEFEIKWKAKNIKEAEIFLFREGGEKMKIAENIKGSSGAYRWRISVSQAPAQDYKIQIVSYDRKGNKLVDTSDKIFEIRGPRFASCYHLILRDLWPYFPSDFPQLKRVFITQNLYTGNLGGLDGADKICQKEAEALGLAGTWKAFLGDERRSATERLNLDGIFVFESKENAIPIEVLQPNEFWLSLKKLIEASPKKETLLKAYDLLTPAVNYLTKTLGKNVELKYCLPLLGKNLNEMMKNFISRAPSIPAIAYQGIWLGRIFPQEKSECIPLFGQNEYSFTVSCENWASNNKYITNQPIECYLQTGTRVNAKRIAGRGLFMGRDVSYNEYISAEMGDSCSEGHHLLCIEQ